LVQKETIHRWVITQK